MNKRLIVVAGIAVIGAVAYLGWHLVSPLFISNRVVEALPAGLTASAPSGAAAPQSGNASGPAKKGNLRDADGFHKGSGGAAVFRLADGKRLLRLESIDVTNGPDLHVYLSAHPDPRSREDVHQPGYADLGKLKANQGSQNYDIPGEVDLNAIRSVVIYCQPFHVVFSAATLE